MKKKAIFNLEKGFYIVTGGMGLLGKMHCEAIAEFGGVPVIFDIEPNDFNEFAKGVETHTSIKPIFIKIIKSLVPVGDTYPVVQLPVPTLGTGVP